MDQVKNYIVYWIRHVTHINPYKDGYIGITKQQLQKRFIDHKSNKKNIHLRYRCMKNNVVCSPLLRNLTEQEAKFEELLYRPLKNIGWNIAIGGGIPPTRLGMGTTRRVGQERTIKQQLAAKQHSKFMSGKLSTKRGKRYTQPKVCLTCGVEYYNYNTRSKYCNLICFGYRKK